MAGDTRCAGRKASDGRRCRRARRPGQRYCAEHLAAAETSEHDDTIQSRAVELYAGLLGPGERGVRETALTIRSLEPEIALLRVLIGEHATEPETVRKLVATLIRAVQVERGLQQGEAAELSTQIQAFLASLDLLPAPDQS